MIYQYECPKCLLKFDDNKPVARYKEVTPCPNCSTVAIKLVASGISMKMGTKKVNKDKGFQSGWNPALGCHVGGRKHYSRLLKERGLEEAGNDRPPEQSAPKTDYFDDKMIKSLHDNGVKLDGEAVKALREDKVKVNE